MKSNLAFERNTQLIKKIMFCGVILMCFVMCVSSSEYNTILTEVSSSESSSCNDEKFFSKFDLNDIPQFGALCNIAIPNINQVKYLLEYNVVPVLCMGFYDVSLRLCKTASVDNFKVTEIFPPSINKFSKLFNTLDKADEFSSLDRFCSSTAGNYKIITAASNVTKEWWDILNEQLNKEDTCKILCHTSENNKVQPLCSYIIWSNGVHLNYQKNEVESQATAMSVGQGNVDSINSLGEPKKEPEDFPLPAVQNELNFSPTVAKVYADSLSLVHNVSNPKVQGANSTSSNITVESVGSAPVPVITAEANLGPTPVVETLKTAQDKSVVVDINNNTSDVKAAEKNVEETEKKDLKEKPTGKEVNVKSVKVDDEGMNVADSSVPTKEKQQASKPKADKGDAMVEGDFSFESTPEGVGLEQPIGADKDQQPYSVEEDPDDDGDDVEMEQEGPVKAAPNKTGVSKASASKPRVVSSDQGIAEPDKVYSEVDREILIEDHFIETEDSHFFTYFLCLAVLVILFYLAFYNKKKLVALAIEGRRTRNSRRRPNCSNYSKLDCSLEEAMASNMTASVTHVLY